MRMVTIQENEIRLNTQLDEKLFAKVKYDVGLMEDGILATCTKTDKNNYSFEFSPWHFNEIKSYTVEGSENPKVFYCGKLEPLSKNSKTLLQIFEQASLPTSTENDKLLMKKAGYIVCTILTQVAKENLQQSFPQNGGGSILMDLESDVIKVLFLPGDVFKYTTNSLEDSQSLLEYNAWVNNTLDGLPYLCFERAVIAYKVLTGRFPFENTNTIEKNADILDKNFLPLELCINNIDTHLAYEINRALKLNSNYVNRPEHMKTGKSSQELKPTTDFPLDTFYEQITTNNYSTISTEDFSKKVQAYIKNKQYLIATKRKIRKNTTVISITTAVLIFAAIFTFLGIRTRMLSATSMGLTSTQTIEAFFQGLNNKDTTQMENVSNGKDAQSLIKTVSQIWVIGNQRQYYERGNGYANPQNWLFYVSDDTSDSTSGIFGVSNVKIDGKKTDLDLLVPLKYENVEPLDMENNITLKEGMTSVHKVEYFYFYSEGEDNAFVVESVSAICTLTFKKQRWFITQIQLDSTELDFDCRKFKDEYFDLLANNGCDVMSACKTLESKYSFIPSQKVLQLEKERLQEIENDIWGRDPTSRTRL